MFLINSGLIRLVIILAIFGSCIAASIYAFNAIYFFKRHDWEAFAKKVAMIAFLFAAAIIAIYLLSKGG